MSYLQTSVLSHAQKVKRLYKAAIRNLQSYHIHRSYFRYEAVLMRARFDEHKNEQDVVKAKKLLEDGEKELFEKLHPQPFKFPDSPGGVAHGRDVYSPDWMFDMWHPLERAQYPEYFKKREQRKLEYIERWEKKYGKAEADHGH